MAEISAQLVKKLRDKTGAGMMECKRALEEAQGDLEQAEVILRKRGIAAAARKASREARQGAIGTYIHPGNQLGVLVEVNCETDFVARNEEFLQLVHDIAMQIAATDPQFIRKEDVTEDVLAREREIERERARAEGKPENVIDRIVEGRLKKFFEEVCLYEQPFIKDNSLTVGQLIATYIAKLGENIVVSQFARFKVGEKPTIARTTTSEQTAEETAVGAGETKE